MDIEKIAQELEKKFNEPLPEFYNRRIIFWNDSEREFENQLPNLKLSNAKLAIVNANNVFQIKKLLCADDTASNYLVYNPLTFERDDDDWLLNVKLYSENFSADLISIWIEEMLLPSTESIRQQVKGFRKFFAAKDRREGFTRLNKNISTPEQVNLAIMAVLCGNSDISENHIIQSVLSAGLDMSTNSIYQKFIQYDMNEIFWAMVENRMGYAEDEQTLESLALHLMMTAAARTIYTTHLDKLNKFILISHQANCYDFISEWLHSEKRSELYKITIYVENKLQLRKFFSELIGKNQINIEDFFDTECFTCINECIIIEIVDEILNEIIDVVSIKKIVDKRRTMPYYELVSCYYEALWQFVNMQAFYIGHADGFHMVESHKIWKNYTADYYKMDTYYRQYHVQFQQSLQNPNLLLDDMFKHLTDKVEGLYRWFIDELGDNWSNACADDLANYGRILEVPQQKDFYLKVKNNDSRVFVIISDALRYEVAVSLADELRLETRSKVNLTSCAAIFPTITKFGMAALLPHQKLELKKNGNQLNILADGQSTESNNRDKVLKSANRLSVALKYDELINLKRAERATLVKGMEVIYIYHDKIDAVGHISESQVFTACEEAINDIKNIVRIITNDFGGTKIYITSDHGFIYTYSTLQEYDKIDKKNFTDYVVEYNRRYVITDKAIEPDYLIPVKLLSGDTGYEAFATRGNIRIKLKGAGLNFVHGGISLQEVVVPIIEYHHLRSSSKEYQRNRALIDTKPVQIKLLTSSRKLSNFDFSLKFYQTEAIGSNRKAATYILYFSDSDGKQVSDLSKIIANKTEEDLSKRIFQCKFHLRAQKYDRHKNYYLVIADETGTQILQREEFEIALSMDY